MEEKRENETAEEGATSAPSRGGRFDRYVGALPVFKGIEEINKWVREIREDRFSWDG